MGVVQIYWTMFAAMLIVLANAFWVRGTASRWSLRWRAAMRSLRGPQAAALASLALAFMRHGRLDLL